MVKVGFFKDNKKKVDRVDFCLGEREYWTVNYTGTKNYNLKIFKKL